MSVGDDLLEALQALGSAGSFWAAGSVANAPLGLDIDDFGSMSFPFNPAQANELRRVCHQAPYGQGEKTLVDTNVRRVWVLDADKFRLTSPGWKKTLDGIVKTVQKDLGLEKEKLDAHLYNLLLYEKGSFFLPHRDGERLDGMVATLVIVLPCSFEGGELIVRHEGQEKRITFGAGEPNPGTTLHYAAFYADCEHEVRPLTQGQRVCLVYNLTLAKAKKLPTAPVLAPHIATIARLLGEWGDQPPTKIALALSHRYSQEGLTWEGLKGRDRAWASAVAQASQQAGFVVHLALVTLWESGEGEYRESGYGRRSRWSRYEEAEEEKEQVFDENEQAHDTSGKSRPDAEIRASGNHVMEEVYDTSLTVEHWTDAKGGHPPLGAMTILPEEIVPPNAVTYFSPQEDYQGYTGNEGCPLERWYRRATLVLWSVPRHFEAISACSAQAALANLEILLTQADEAEPNERELLRQQCRTFALGILANWNGNKRGRASRSSPETTDFLAPLIRLGDPEVIVSYLSNVVLPRADSVPDKRLPGLIDRWGWAKFGPALREMFTVSSVRSAQRDANFLESLAFQETRKKDERNDLCSALMDLLLIGVSPKKGEHAHRHWEPKAVDFLASLGRTLIQIERILPFQEFVKHVQENADRYSLVDQIQAIIRVDGWRREEGKEAPPQYREWIESCCAPLRVRTATMPTPPADQRRKANFTCVCADCNVLRTFLEDPVATERAFARNVSLRKHIAEQVEDGKCDVSTRLDVNAKPQALVLTKTQASYGAALKKYHADRATLATLEKMAQPLPTKVVAKPAKKKKK